MQNSNFVPVKGVVEYFNNILLQNKRKGAQSELFSVSHNFNLKYLFGETLQSLER
jgi:hypothetical protein